MTMGIQCPHGCAWEEDRPDLACPHVAGGARAVGERTIKRGGAAAAPAPAAAEFSPLAYVILSRMRDALARQEALRLERERIERQRTGTRPRLGPW